MIYVTSDLHGCPPEKFRALLDKAGFTEDDFLYILGDVIDRGEFGAELLLWISQQTNMELIMGNHESMLLSCDFLFEDITTRTLARLNMRSMDIYRNWLMNGGAPTVDGLKKLLKEDPESFRGVMEYVEEAPLYEEVEAGGRQFLLVHSGINNFEPEKPIGEYVPYDLIWCRPTLEARYYEDKTTVFGHTPTDFYGPQYSRRALHTDTWICIDTGAAMGRMPMLLRLDDLAEFYWEE